MGIKKTLNPQTGKYELDKPKRVVWTTLGLHYRIETLEKQVAKLQDLLLK